MNEKQDLKTADEVIDATDQAVAAPEDGEVQVEVTDDAAPESDGQHSELELLTAEIADLKNEVLRARADAENVRKRAERDVEAAHKYGLERLVGELLPVKDSLDLGFSAAATASEVGSLTEGMELTVKMFNDFFEKLCIEEIDPAGLPFNPDFHQAMTVEESTEAEPGTVVKVIQKGFLLNARLVRPALVIVAKAAESSA
ncbi:MAG: nucleotide exchange factor GrpE [Gammaproteobacteria bacterium]|nr:nucleotide exchange factor GrpE [Gammaproteobacteria bacterium]